MKDKYKFAKAWAIYTAHTLALKDASDQRKSESQRANDLRKWLYKPEISTAVRFYTERLKLMDIGLVELDSMLNSVLSIVRNEPRYYGNYPCCDSCHVGSSATPLSEIESQRNYYGTYICVRCEEIAFNMGKVKFSLFDGRMFLKDEGISSGRMLGFGGSVFLIKHKTGNVSITNNLFCNRSMHTAFLPILQDYVNCELVWVERLADVRNSTTPEQFESLSKSISILRENGYLVRE